MLAAGASCGSPKPASPTGPTPVVVSTEPTSTVTATAPPVVQTPEPTIEPDVVLIGAGDIARCDVPGWGGAVDTAQMLDALPGIVFTLGDNVYMHGTEEEFRTCYQPSWGRHKARTRPAPGNHDYGSSGARPYFDYFGANAGPSGLGYYTYTAGAWRIYSLNSEVAADERSAQFAWLRQELTASPSRCTMAYWHKPLVSSGRNGDNREMRPIWELLYQHGVELVLAGHDHSYERFAPQDDRLRPDPERGIRQIIAGTGGAAPYSFSTVRPNSEVRASVLGLLRLTLRSDGYSWEFLPSAGQAFRDDGSDRCH